MADQRACPAPVAARALADDAAEVLGEVGALMARIAALGVPGTATRTGGAA